MSYKVHLEAEYFPVRLYMRRPLTDKQLLRFSSRNEPLRVEREPGGELSIEVPMDTRSGFLLGDISGQLHNWADKQGQGLAFGPNAGFRLPDTAVRAAKSAWVSSARWDALTEQQQEEYAPLCPEFILELRTSWDKLPALQNRMRGWIQNGAQLAWLVDPKRRCIEIYRPGAAEAELLENPAKVHGEGPVAGFVLDLTRIW